MIRSAFSKASLVIAGALVTLTAIAVADEPVHIDSKLMPYKQASGVSGNIKTVGSDTMNNMVTLWAEDFRKVYPNVQVEIEGKGSSTAPPALVEGTATFGPMSRTMKDEEVDQFEAKYGYKPTAIRTSIDMLSIYVNKDNPIQNLTLQQVDAIFSKTRKGGAATDIRTWGDLGLTGEWKDKPISLYGRNSASGTYGYFKEHALFKGDYKDEVKEQPGSAAVVQAVSSDRYAIGYSGIGYKTADVREVPLKATAADEPISATPEYAYTGKYPLSRFLYIYVNLKPGTPLDPLRREFLLYVLSKDGQSDVIKDGYFPVNAKIAGEELAKLGLSK
jgi:phosphate transport system substrate-binding protein